MRFYLMMSVLLATAACAVDDSVPTNAQGETVINGDRSPAEEYRQQKEYEDRQHDMYRTLRP